MATSKSPAIIVISDDEAEDVILISSDSDGDDGRDGGPETTSATEQGDLNVGDPVRTAAVKSSSPGPHLGRQRRKMTPHQSEDTKNRNGERTKLDNEHTFKDDIQRAIELSLKENLRKTEIEKFSVGLDANAQFERDMKSAIEQSLQENLRKTEMEKFSMGLDANAQFERDMKSAIEQSLQETGLNRTSRKGAFLSSIDSPQKFGISTFRNRPNSSYSVSDTVFDISPFAENYAVKSSGRETPPPKLERCDKNAVCLAKNRVNTVTMLGPPELSLNCLRDSETVNMRNCQTRNPSSVFSLSSVRHSQSSSNGKSPFQMLDNAAKSFPSVQSLPNSLHASTPRTKPCFATSSRSKSYLHKDGLSRTLKRCDDSCSDFKSDTSDNDLPNYGISSLNSDSKAYANRTDCKNSALQLAMYQQKNVVCTMVSPVKNAAKGTNGEHALDIPQLVRQDSVSPCHADVYPAHFENERLTKSCADRNGSLMAASLQNSNGPVLFQKNGRPLEKRPGKRKDVQTDVLYSSLCKKKRTENGCSKGTEINKSKSNIGTLVNSHKADLAKQSANDKSKLSAKQESCRLSQSSSDHQESTTNSHRYRGHVTFAVVSAKNSDDERNITTCKNSHRETCGKSSPPVKKFKKKQKESTVASANVHQKVKANAQVHEKHRGQNAASCVASVIKSSHDLCTAAKPSTSATKTTSSFSLAKGTTHPQKVAPSPSQVKTSWSATNSATARPTSNPARAALSQSPANTVSDPTKISSQSKSCSPLHSKKTLSAQNGATATTGSMRPGFSDGHVKSKMTSTKTAISQSKVKFTVDSGKTERATLLEPVANHKKATVCPVKNNLKGEVVSSKLTSTHKQRSRDPPCQSPMAKSPTAADQQVKCTKKQLSRAYPSAGRAPSVNNLTLNDPNKDRPTDAKQMPIPHASTGELLEKGSQKSSRKLACPGRSSNCKVPITNGKVVRRAQTQQKDGPSSKTRPAVQRKEEQPCVEKVATERCRQSTLSSSSGKNQTTPTKNNRPAVSPSKVQELHSADLQQESFSPEKTVMDMPHQSRARPLVVLSTAPVHVQLQNSMISQDVSLNTEPAASQAKDGARSRHCSETADGKLSFGSKHLYTIEACQEEGHHNAAVQLIQDFVTTERKPPKEIYEYLIKDVLLESKNKILASSVYAALSHIQSLHPVLESDIDLLDWNFVSGLVEKILTFSNQDGENQVVYNNILCLEYVVSILESDLQANVSSPQKSMAALYLAGEMQGSRLNSLISWVIDSVRMKFSLGHLTSEGGRTRAKESTRLLPMLQKLLEMSVTVSRNPPDTATKVAEEIVYQYLSLPSLGCRQLLLESMGSHLVRAKLIELLLENCCELDVSSFDEMRSPGQWAALSVKKILEHHFQRKPVNNPFSTDESTDSVQGEKESEACEELVMMLYCLIQSHLHCVRGKLHQSLTVRHQEDCSRLPLSQMSQSGNLTSDDLECLKNIQVHISQLRQRLLRYCRDFTCKTILLFQLMEVFEDLG